MRSSSIDLGLKHSGRRALPSPFIEKVSNEFQGPLLLAFPAENVRPDKGESVQKLIANPAPGAPVPPILAPVNGFLMLDKAKFAASFAADVPAKRAEFLSDAQVLWGVDALAGEVTEAAWRTKPSWYLITNNDKMIPPDAQRVMSKRAGAVVVESAGSHAVYESKPSVVAALIEKAAGVDSVVPDTHSRR